jgi:hypothetical protein
MQCSIKAVVQPVGTLASVRYDVHFGNHHFRAGKIDFYADLYEAGVYDPRSETEVRDTIDAILRVVGDNDEIIESPEELPVKNRKDLKEYRHKIIMQYALPEKPLYDIHVN